jgi:hypothetical protein
LAANEFFLGTGFLKGAAMAGIKNRSGGHNRLSAEVHALRGTFRKSRHGRRKAPPVPVPVVAVLTIEPPGHLTPEESACWRELAPRPRFWGPADVVLLELFVVHVSHHRRLAVRFMEATQQQQDPSTVFAPDTSKILRQLRQEAAVVKVLKGALDHAWRAQRGQEQLPPAADDPFSEFFDDQPKPPSKWAGVLS